MFEDTNTTQIDVSIETESSQPTTVTTFPFADDLAKTLYQFLDALADGNTERLISYAGVRSPEAYAFWEGTDVVGYEILDRLPPEYNSGIETFIVELDISTSTNPLFPVGKSNWKFTTIFDDTGFFGPVYLVDKTYDDIKRVGNIDDGINPARYFCYRFTVELDSYLNSLPEGRTCSDFNEFIPPAALLSIDKDTFSKEEIDRATNFGTMLMRFVNAVSTKREENSYYNKLELLYDKAQSILGITDIKLTRSKLYRSDTDSLDNNFLGGYWKYATLTSEEVDIEGNTVIVLDWYADNLMLVKACTLKYTLKPIEHGFRFLSLEELFNTGYELAYGTT